MALDGGDLAERWQGEVDRAQAIGRLPGIGVAVLRDGELVWQGSAGVVGPVGEQYRIGSLTKTFVAVEIMRLRREGRLDLTSVLGEWIPESEYRSATLGDLLSHTSGMRSEPVGSWWERRRGDTFEELLEANPGECAVSRGTFHYSNLGFAFLGEVIARVRRRPWFEVIADEILEPVGLAETTYAPIATPARGYSVDHYSETLTEEPHPDTVAMAPAGQLWSTLEDLARWGRYLTHGDDRIIDRQSLELMAREVTPAYGLGLRVMRAGGRALVGHTGTMPGFRAGLFVDLEAGDGVVMVTNATTGINAMPFTRRVLDPRTRGGFEQWRPNAELPDLVRDVLGPWFWGNTALEMRYRRGVLELLETTNRAVTDRFELRGGDIVGLEGYHDGERLVVHRRGDGGVSHLECATFVYTRSAYDPGVPVAGGHPR